MAHIHRAGPVWEKTFPVNLTASKPTNTILSGDLIAEQSGAVPAANFTWTTDLATTQTNFAAAFLGVANARSRAGTTDARDLTMLTDMVGEFEMDCASGNYTVGQYVGPAKDTGNNLKQTVEGVATKARAIGVVLEAGTSITRVKVALLNTIPLR
jgi:hypothetical protein